MAKFDKYDVIMKMLEIIEHDANPGSIVISEEQRQKVTNIIGTIKGNVLFQQIEREETSVEIGDRFENINQSIIATRGAITEGIIKINQAGEHDLANALEKLEKAIYGVPKSEMSEKAKQEAFQLLDELTRQASSPNRTKTVVVTLGKGLWDAIKNVNSISQTVTLVWPIIGRLWT